MGIAAIPGVAIPATAPSRPVVQIVEGSKKKDGTSSGAPRKRKSNWDVTERQPKAGVSTETGTLYTLQREQKKEKMMMKRECYKRY